MRAPSFWYRHDPGAAALARLLAPIGAVYGYCANAKRARTSAYRARAKILCVGNLTLGGTGKTPVAIALAEKLKGMGLNVYFLTRGYGGTAPGPLAADPGRHAAQDIGDEALLLQRTAPAIVSRDRQAGARMADALGAEIVIMDDGHQNHSLVKDLSVVVADAEAGFGNGRVFPAGPLRETVADGLARADAVILIGEGHLALGAFTGPVLRGRIEPKESEGLRGAKVVAFAGIGRPEKFFATLKALGAVITAQHSFADHHRYSGRELTTMREEAFARDSLLVTTEKDFVRIAPQERSGITAVAVEIAFGDNAGIIRLLDKLAAKHANPSS